MKANITLKDGIINSFEIGYDTYLLSLYTDTGNVLLQTLNVTRIDIDYVHEVHGQSRYNLYLYVDNSWHSTISFLGISQCSIYYLHDFIVNYPDKQDKIRLI